MPSGPDGPTYREKRPPAALAGLVECFWRRELWRPPKPHLGVLPDGRVDLLWAVPGKVVVIGPQTRSLAKPLPPQVVVVGVRFPPGVGAPLLGVPAHELVDRQVLLEAVDTRRAASLGRDLAGIEHPAEAPAVIARAVARRIDSEWRPDPAVRRASMLLEDPRERVERVAEELAISRRQLERRFREAVGYGPKTLQRVLRFRRLLEALASGQRRAAGLARIAATIGYSDQGHLTRESGALSGHSPVQLERALGALKAAGASGVCKSSGRGAAGVRAVRGPSSRPTASE